MKTFTYYGVNAWGKQMKDEIQAQDQAGVTLLIKKMGIFPTRLEEKNLGNQPPPLFIRLK